MNRPALRASRLWSLSIACGVLQLFAIGPSMAAQETGEYIGWAVGDVDVHPPQPQLVCPPGSFIRSVSVTQDEWLAHIGIYCQTPDKLQSADPKMQMWTGTPGLDAGGDGGSGAHSATLTCPSSFVDGLTGLRTSVQRLSPFVLQYFAADPRFFCGTYSAPGATVIKDTQFRRSGHDAVRYNEMNSLYPDPGTQAKFRCPRRWAATGIWYKLGGFKKDDIQAFGLICGALPAPPASKAIMRRTRP